MDSSSSESAPTPEPEPTPEPTPEPEPTPVATGLEATASINSWGSGYQVSFKIANNTGNAVNGWTLKVPTSELNMTASWNVNVAEQGGYYVITPVDWNSAIANGQSVEFGCIGSGSIGNSLSLSIE